MKHERVGRLDDEDCDDPAALTFSISGHRVLVADPAMLRLYRLIKRLARTQLPILIFGESGVGKEHAASAVHAWSGRASAPLIAFNCAALHQTLIEGELFGHERGAFSGAVASKLGLFERADHGTLFLDEVSELSSAAQAKLLRVLEGQPITRLGGVREHVVDVRVVAATNGDLGAAVMAGRFRQDLFFRLNGAVVTLPPLRCRRSEILILAQHFLNSQRSATTALSISVDAGVRLLSHRWTGNIRELKHAMEYASAIVEGDCVEPWHLPEAVGIEIGERKDSAETDLDVAETARPELPAKQRDRSTFRPLSEELHALERHRIEEALRATGGVQRRAAQLIGMPVRTFTCKLRKFRLRAASGPASVR
jgi:two-component system, NtrC family, response regulator AtoC